MDTRVGKYMEGRPLGHALVAVSELCAWSEGERLPYDFQQIIGDFKFVQAEFLFPIVAQWSTQHLSPEAAQGIMGKRGETAGGHLIADDPSHSMWAVTGDAHIAFERLFYQAVKAGKLRLLDGITRMPINPFTPESLARYAEVGGDADTLAAVRVEVVPLTSATEAWKVNARQIGKDILKGNKSLNVERIAEKTNKVMIDRNAKGEHGMTGRGGKVPSADTIKRHALTGIKA